MADEKVSALTNHITSFGGTERFYVVDYPAGSPVKGYTEYTDLESAIRSGIAAWTSESGTWTYASASTFTISGDQTAIYVKGTKLRWVQTTTKYGVVVSSSYSAPNTTVTIAVNSDYTIANAAISSPYYSYQVVPAGYPGWFNFVPTVTGFSPSPTVICRFNIQGNICHFEFVQTATGTSNATTFTVTMPVTAKNTANYFQYGCIPDCRNNGSIEAVGVVYATPNSAILTLLRSAQAAWTASGQKFAGFTMDVEF